MGRITSFSKQVIVFFLVTALIIRPTFAANVGGWTLGGGVAQGASTVYDGTKQVIIDGKNYIKKGIAIVTPTATGVAKVLARGAAGYALSVAVEQLLGSVDWVLDPANNQIKYTTSHPYGVFTYAGQTFTSIAAADAYCKTRDSINYQAGSIGAVVQGNTLYCRAKYKSNGAQTNVFTFQGNVLQDEKEQTYPLSSIASKVISNAESGDTHAQVATTAAAADIVAEAEGDSTKAKPIVDQLNGSSSTKPADSDAAANAGTGTATATPRSDPVTGEQAPPTDIALKFPVFCNWAPTVCEAAQTVISFPTTLADWWNTGKTKAEEWALSISEAWSKVKEEYYDQPEENTDTQLDLPDQSDPNINTDLSFGGSCPASRSVPVSFAGIHTEIEFSFQWFCEVASIAKPVVISISAFAAALIVAGVRTEDD